MVETVDVEGKVTVSELEAVVVEERAPPRAPREVRVGFRLAEDRVLLLLLLLLLVVEVAPLT